MNAGVSLNARNDAFPRAVCEISNLAVSMWRLHVEPRDITMNNNNTAMSKPILVDCLCIYQ